jgi:Leucine-rich repeat (LRR) protein
MKSLTHLSLSKNKLKYLPSEIGHLAKLVELLVADNQLMELPPSLGLLSKLEILVLRSNNLVELPVEMGFLTKLNSLDISSNPIVTFPTEIARLSIKFCMFSGCNSLLSVIPEDFGPKSFPSLKELSARCIIRNRTVTGQYLHRSLSDYLSKFHTCSSCLGPYYFYFLSRIRFVFLYDRLLPVEDRLCQNHWDNEESRIISLFAPYPSSSPLSSPHPKSLLRPSLIRSLSRKHSSFSISTPRPLLKSPSLPALKGHNVPKNLLRRLRGSKSMTFSPNNPGNPVHHID